MKKIAIASKKNSLNSEICQTAGRAPFYLIFENKELIKTIKNPFVSGSGGAGYGVAQMLANENVNVVISGKFGENMTTTLEKKGIKVKEIKDKKVKEFLAENE